MIYISYKKMLITTLLDLSKIFKTQKVSIILKDCLKDIIHYSFLIQGILLIEINIMSKQYKLLQ